MEVVSVLDMCIEEPWSFWIALHLHYCFLIDKEGSDVRFATWLDLKKKTVSVIIAICVCVCACVQRGIVKKLNGLSGGWCGNFSTRTVAIKPHVLHIRTWVMCCWLYVNALSVCLSFSEHCWIVNKPGSSVAVSTELRGPRTRSCSVYESGWVRAVIFHLGHALLRDCVQYCTTVLGFVVTVTCSSCVCPLPLQSTICLFTTFRKSYLTSFTHACHYNSYFQT